MKTLTKEKSIYTKHFTRSETKTQEYELHEDFLIASELCKKCAEVSYVLEHGKDEETKVKAKEILERLRTELFLQQQIIAGYFMREADKGECEDDKSN